MRWQRRALDYVEERAEKLRVVRWLFFRPRRCDVIVHGLFVLYRSKLKGTPRSLVYVRLVYVQSTSSLQQSHVHFENISQQGRRWASSRQL